MGALGVCALVGAVVAAVRPFPWESPDFHLRSTRGPPRLGAGSPGGRVALGFLALVVVFTFAEVGVLALLGSRLGVPRYLVPGLEAALVLTSCALACQPAIVGALVLALVGVSEARREPGNKGQEWREAQRLLAALEPGPADPVLLMTGYGGADWVVEPARFTPAVRGMLSAPLEIVVGQPPPQRRLFLLTRTWGLKGQPRYFEAELVPLLESAPRFFVVAHPGYAALLGDWVARRFPGRFRRTFVSREFAAPIVVERYEAGASLAPPQPGR